MEGLARGIIRSHDARVAGITSLGAEVASRRQEAQASLGTMARRQHAVLAKGHADLATATATQLGDLRTARHGAAKQQQSDLAMGRANLARRMAMQLRELTTGRQAMGRQQHAELASGNAALVRGTAALLGGFAVAHKVVVQRQRSYLAEARAALTPAEGHRRSSVEAWMQQVAGTRAGARAAWESLCGVMRARRVGTSAPADSPSSAGTAEPAGDPALAIDAAPDESAASGRADGMVETLADRAFDYLAGRPGGTRLTEVEQELGVGRFYATRAVRHLMDRGKVQKRDLLYFTT